MARYVILQNLIRLGTFYDADTEADLSDWTPDELDAAIRAGWIRRVETPATAHEDDGSEADAPSSRRSRSRR